MSVKKLPELPEKLEELLDKPYGGLFGNTVLAQVVEEIVADPTMDYRPRYLEEMTGKRSPSIREALKALVKLGLIENVSRDVQHPVYRVVVESKMFIALSLLAYAVIDDRDGTDCMNAAILDYYNRSLRAKAEPLAVATNCAGEWTIKGNCSEPDEDSGHSTFTAGA
ncbi:MULTISPECIES: hypothetical protein [unclassified Methanoculleus]|uniref:hypothetical protein n=1 Tax=unclassified Methanoculleus TaxID=2619537 RepID=UPI00319E20CC